MRNPFRLFVVAALAAVLAFPCAAQIPRPKPRSDGKRSKILNLVQAQQFMATASFTRTLVVDNGGSGDYLTIHEALAYVTTQTRDQYNQWTVQIVAGEKQVGKLGHYVETTLTIPSYTALQGLGRRRASGLAFAGNAILEMTGTSGVLISLDKYSQIQDLDIVLAQVDTTLTGDVKLIAKNVGTGGNNSATIANCNISTISLVTAYAVTLVSNDSGTITMYDTSTGCNGSTSTARNIVQNDASSSNAVNVYGGRHFACTGQVKLAENTGAAPLRFYGSRIDARATYDLVKTGAGNVEVHHTEYATASGTITDTALRARTVTFNQGPIDQSGTGAPEGAVTAPIGSTWRRTDCTVTATCFCVKETGTGNTGWVCK